MSADDTNHSTDKRTEERKAANAQFCDALERGDFISAIDIMFATYGGHDPNDYSITIDRDRGVAFVKQSPDGPITTIDITVPEEMRI